MDIFQEDATVNEILSLIRGQTTSRLHLSRRRLPTCSTDSAASFFEWVFRVYSNVELFPIFFHRASPDRVGLGWVDKEYGERRQKLQSARPAPLFCFHVPIHYSALLSFGPKIRTFKFLFVGLFFEAKSMIITTYEI